MPAAPAPDVPPAATLRWWPLAAICLAVAALGACGLPSPTQALRHGAPLRAAESAVARAVALRTTTTTTTPPALGPLTSPPLPPPAPGFRPGVVTAIGDSVMLDAEPDLQHDVPGIEINAAVSRQWTDGEAVLSQLKSVGFVGAVVVVALGTNGPITAADFDQMMAIVAGASRIVIVTVHVDQPWQNPVNEVLEAGVKRYPRAVLADWASLAATNPEWFGSDGTHLPIGGPALKLLRPSLLPRCEFPWLKQKRPSPDPHEAPIIQSQTQVRRETLGSPHS